MIENPAALIVGAGPAGLAAAIAICRAGHSPVLVVDRDDEPGGLPRFCHHPGFGWAYTHRLESGPAFASRMVNCAQSAGAVLMSRTTALKVEPGPVVQIVGPECGLQSISPRAVVLATGIRETARGPRLIAGARPDRGLFTTGSLQQHVTRGVEVKSRRLVIVGTEHVSFSAALTARKTGMRTVAMLESCPSVRSYAALGLLARLTGVAVHTGTSICGIDGDRFVEGIEVKRDGHKKTIPCDAVLFSGEWIPEASLCVSNEINIDNGSKGPVIDNLFRTSMEGVFAAGNLLRSIESSGVAAREGACAGASAADFMSRQMVGWQGATRVETTEDIEFFVPQRLSLPANSYSAGSIVNAYFRANSDHHHAQLTVTNSNGVAMEAHVGHLKRGRVGTIRIEKLCNAIASDEKYVTVRLF